MMILKNLNCIRNEEIQEKVKKIGEKKQRSQWVEDSQKGIYDNGNTKKAGFQGGCWWELGFLISFSFGDNFLQVLG